MRGGETIELASDLGGGKTVFTQGLAKGLGYEGQLASPTFAISRVYKLPGDLELHHFDFYRLPSGDIVADELADVVGDKKVIVVVEWGGAAGNALPADRLQIHIKPTAEDERELTIVATGPGHKHLIQELQS